MRKLWNIRLLLPGIWLVLLSCTLSGCNQGEEVTFFSEEVNGQREEGPAAEALVADGMIAEGALSEMGVQAETADVTEIVVYICGAVKEPGVITLSEGSRMHDALQMAGGFLENAAVTSVNLAEKLEDEQMIYVLTKEEAEAQVTACNANSSGVENGLVNINTANIETLCSLPGIGESKARDIVTYREKQGAFQKKEDIMQVTGIKENLYRKICDLISVK